MLASSQRLCIWLRRHDVVAVRDTKTPWSLGAGTGAGTRVASLVGLKTRTEDCSSHLPACIPKVRGGSDNLFNRIGFCSNCNHLKGKKEWTRSSFQNVRSSHIRRRPSRLLLRAARSPLRAARNFRWPLDITKLGRIDEDFFGVAAEPIRV